MPTRTRVVILQHPREARVAIGTARMAHLMLPNSEILRPAVTAGGRQFLFGEHPLIRQLTAEPAAAATALLFPGEGACDPALLAEDAVTTLVVIDGTWAQAHKVSKQNPILHRLPRIGLTPSQPGNYRIRREPTADCLATVEALAQVLGVLERSPPRFLGMLSAFTFMVDQQLAMAAARTGPTRCWQNRVRQSQAEAHLREQLARAVVVHAEVNAYARASCVPGRAELLHLVARRLSTGEPWIDLRLVVARRVQQSPGMPAAAAQRLGAPPAEPVAAGRAGRTAT